MAKGKLYRSRLEQVDNTRQYVIQDAIKVLKDMPHAKFDETVELSFNLGVDPRQSDQAVRGALSLPHGTGKTQRVVVVASGDAAKAARDAGADEVGYDELLKRISEGWLEFDVMIATPAAMSEVRKLGRVLGPRGLMPNPKTGTVTDDTAKAVRESKGGRVEYRTDRGGCAHVAVGKVSFGVDALAENAMAVVAALIRAKPPKAKGTYLKSATISSTMSPGIKLDTRQFLRSE